VNNQSKNINLFFWVFTTAVAFILTLPILIKDGMFMDGVLYTAVSHNLANGIGTFWFPKFSYNNLAGIHDSFHEQPPLVFGIQAVFFKVFGSSLYVERFYVFVTLLLNMFLIKKSWELLFKTNERFKQLSWLPVLFWISIPVCFWSYSCNMHENTVSVFVLAAVILQFKAYEEQKTNMGFIWMILSGIFIFLASFSKGIPGLFPIAAPMAYWLYNKSISLKKILVYILVLLSTVALIYFVILLNNDAKESLYNYFYLRLLKRINDVPTTGNYLDSLFRLVQETLILIGIVLLTKLSMKELKLKTKATTNLGYIFLLIGLMGVIPLMLTLVQKGFYMVPAFPFIAIGFALLLVNEVDHLISTKLLAYKGIKWVKVCFVLLFVFSLILPITQIGKYSRNEEILKDIYVAGKLIPERSVINCSLELEKDWTLQTYLSRYFFISLDVNADHAYFLCDQNEYQSDSEKFKNFQLVPSEMKLYVLLKRVN